MGIARLLMFSLPLWLACAGEDFTFRRAVECSPSQRSLPVTFWASFLGVGEEGQTQRWLTEDAAPMEFRGLLDLDAGTLQGRIEYDACAIAGESGCEAVTIPPQELQFQVVSCNDAGVLAEATLEDGRTVRAFSIAYEASEADEDALCTLRACDEEPPADVPYG